MLHAAYISGYTAAEEILRLKNNDNSLDPPTEQVKHGIKKWDVICPIGSEVFLPLNDTSFNDSNENVNCITIHNATRNSP